MGVWVLLFWKKRYLAKNFYTLNVSKQAVNFHIIKEHGPNQLAIETVLFSKNQKTAMQVAEARGVIIFIAIKHGLPIREFNPNQIKLAVTGYGKGDKKQVVAMVEKLIKMPGKQKRHDDEYDAIACALTASAISLSTKSF